MPSSPGWGLGVGLTTLHCIKEDCWESSKKFSRILRRRPRPKLGCGAKERRRRRRRRRRSTFFLWWTGKCNVVIINKYFNSFNTVYLQKTPGKMQWLFYAHKWSLYYYYYYYYYHHHHHHHHRIFILPKHKYRKAYGGAEVNFHLFFNSQTDGKEGPSYSVSTSTNELVMRALERQLEACDITDRAIINPVSSFNTPSVHPSAPLGLISSRVCTTKPYPLVWLQAHRIRFMHEAITVHLGSYIHLNSQTEVF
jgi:hypothetical protein